MKVRCKTIFLEYKIDLPTQNSKTLDPERKSSTPNKIESITVAPLKEIATPLSRSERLDKPLDHIIY